MENTVLKLASQWLSSHSSEIHHSYGGPQSTEGYAICVQEPQHFFFPLTRDTFPDHLGRELPLIYTHSYCLSLAG